MRSESLISWVAASENRGFRKSLNKDRLRVLEQRFRRIDERKLKLSDEKIGRIVGLKVGDIKLRALNFVT
jgi:hypothetical protein